MKTRILKTVQVNEMSCADNDQQEHHKEQKVSVLLALSYQFDEILIFYNQSAVLCWFRAHMTFSVLAEEDQSKPQKLMCFQFLLFLFVHL